MAGLIDPTVMGKYPVILGDSLLGKTSNDIFTGVQYNHKPTLSSDDAPKHARLKPSVPGKTTSYDLNFSDDGGSYSFTGARTTDDDKYVLYFDAERKAFILDKVDSTFDMNLTRIPTNSDPDDLSRKYPHLGSQRNSKRAGNTRAASDRPKSKAAPTTRVASPKRKTEKKPRPAPKALALPTSKPQETQEKAKPKKKDNDEEDEEEEDDDGGLLIEYPGGQSAAAKKADFSPAFPTQRRFDEYMDQRESEADDADGESDDEPDALFKLPSPINKQHPQEEVPEAVNVGETGSHNVADEVDLEDELEDELEKAFAVEDQANSQEDSRNSDESEISEED